MMRTRFLVALLLFWLAVASLSACAQVSPEVPAQQNGTSIPEGGHVPTFNPCETDYGGLWAEWRLAAIRDTAGHLLFWMFIIVCAGLVYSAARDWSLEKRDARREEVDQSIITSLYWGYAYAGYLLLKERNQIFATSKPSIDQDEIHIDVGSQGPSLGAGLQQEESEYATKAKLMALANSASTQILVVSEADSMRVPEQNVPSSSNSQVHSSGDLATLLAQRETRIAELERENIEISKRLETLLDDPNGTFFNLEKKKQLDRCRAARNIAERKVAAYTVIKGSLTPTELERYGNATQSSE